MNKIKKWKWLKVSGNHFLPSTLFLTSSSPVRSCSLKLTVEYLGARNSLSNLGASFYKRVAMEVIATPDSDDLDVWANTFGKIVHVHFFINLMYLFYHTSCIFSYFGILSFTGSSFIVSLKKPGISSKPRKVFTTWQMWTASSQVSTKCMKVKVKQFWGGVDLEYKSWTNTFIPQYNNILHLCLFYVINSTISLMLC